MYFLNFFDLRGQYIYLMGRRPLLSLRRAGLDLYQFMIYVEEKEKS